ncbi:carbonic anhydrase [Aetokthonos hydrillicola Thurmond2011]|jgi:carbonic anhydrase|uniref:carbonic anhydrase n=1 Tax=Aetokthonos hydrillicola Thurmond2011 TaxID=2712845 RepID=A0AAP5IE86_9CYAN|nr:carbonic anhydrase [Aetokthonos hydrillicola]MBO3458039.1 carbonic anhydrase [Aetokthonos hydrillicola CCALA 1050]MBW4587126.1 carbonic anhydrase [Aetokthonos hydrillicola CCALA 1050]MDR9899624.1 carbonic anhydrase [Aetokthonos hydrillicola Thurmond2011]
MSWINGFVGRRELLKLVGVGGVSLGATAGSSAVWDKQQAVAQQNPKPVSPAVQSNPKALSPDEALNRLVDGNKRFVQQRRQNPNQSVAHLQLVAKAQYPFTAMLSCSDSRVPSEIIFDQGFGDLFVVRVAGNVVTTEGIGSLEFATSVLGAPLIVVLGHKRCGAVSAAVKGEPLPGRIGTFVESIKPSLTKVKTRSGDLVDKVVIANIQYQVEILKQTSTILTQLLESGKLKIVGGRYDLDTGEVTLVT